MDTVDSYIHIDLTRGGLCKVSGRDKYCLKEKKIASFLFVTLKSKYPAVIFFPVGLCSP